MRAKLYNSLQYGDMHGAWPLEWLVCACACAFTSTYVRCAIQIIIIIIRYITWYNLHMNTQHLMQTAPILSRFTSKNFASGTFNCCMTAPLNFIHLRSLFVTRIQVPSTATGNTPVHLVYACRLIIKISSIQLVCWTVIHRDRLLVNIIVSSLTLLYW